MNRPGHKHEAPESSSIRFATTIWGQVLAAGDEQASEHDVALESVCQRYWPPIYAYLRKKGHSPDEAKDLTQAFFQFLLEHHTLTRADPARGRFRSFLLTVLENFVSAQRRHAAVVSRAVIQPLLSWDEIAAERLFHESLINLDTPDKAFERRWAIDLLERAVTRFRASFEHLEQRGLLSSLEPHLWEGRNATPYDQLSRELNASAGSLRIAVHRMRCKYRDIVRSEILATGVPTEEVDDEIQHLIEVMRS